MLKLDHKVVIGYTTINVIGVTTVFVKYPSQIEIGLSRSERALNYLEQI